MCFYFKKSHKNLCLFVIIFSILTYIVSYIEVSPNGKYYEEKMASLSLAYYHFNNNTVKLQFLDEEYPVYNEGSYKKINGSWFWLPEKGDIKKAKLYATVWKIKVFDEDGDLLMELPRLWRYNFIRLLRFME